MGSLLRDLSCFMLQQVSAVSQFPVQNTRMIMQQATKHTAGSNMEIGSESFGFSWRRSSEFYNKKKIWQNGGS